jgi:hypothetical protein
VYRTYIDKKNGNKNLFNVYGMYNHA